MLQRECHITSSNEHVRDVDAMLQSLLASESVEPEQAYAIRLALTEALNNVIEHAYEEEPGNDIHVLQTLDANQLTIVIRDAGKPTPEGALVPRELPEYDMDDPESFPEGGWGLYLIQSHMDQVDYVRQGNENVLTLMKTISRVDTAVSN